MTKSRQKMIRAMELKNLSDYTQKAYLAAVSGIAKFYNQSPEKLTKEKIEATQVSCALTMAKCLNGRRQQTTNAL